MRICAMTWINHFRVTPSLYFKARLRAKPFASSKHSQFQKETMLKTFLVKMNFTSMRTKTHFHGIALSLTLKWTRLAARKLACVAGGILVSGALSWRRSRHAKRVATPRGNFKLTCIPTLLAAPPSKQYSTPTQVPPAAQAFGNGLFSCNKTHFDKKGVALSLFLNVRVFGMANSGFYFIITGNRSEQKVWRESYTWS